MYVPFLTILGFAQACRNYIANVYYKIVFNFAMLNQQSLELFNN